MSDLTLGLELGSDTIGWALLDEGDCKIIAAGVRVFSEGVDRDSSGDEHSKNEARRIARGMRRRTARSARRKKQLRTALVAVGLLPAETIEQTKLDELNPYELRRWVLDQKLSPHEIGRVLVHLNQRRGFNSKRWAGEKRERDDSGMLADIRSLTQEMKIAGHQTLGEHLSNLAAKPGEIPLHRIRGRHAHREMLSSEFNIIWSSQQKHHPTLLTNELKLRLHRIIFFQRDRYWPPSVIDHCDLEPRLLRCPRADRRAQRFRLLQNVNNLRILDASIGTERKLTAEERKYLLALLSKTKELKFDAIRQKLDLADCVRFNLEREGQEKLKGHYTDGVLSHKNLFGKDWFNLPEDDKNRLVSALTKGDEEYICRLGAQLALNPVLIDALIETDLGKGYARYSLHAIKKLLPHLECGLSLSPSEGFPCALSKARYILPGQHVPKQQQFLPEPPPITNPLVRQALHELRRVVNALLREVVYKHGHTLAHVNIELDRKIKGTTEQRHLRIFEMRDRQAQRDFAADEIRKQSEKVTREKIEKYRLWEEQSHICIYSGRLISLAQLLSEEVVVDYILPRSSSLDGSFANQVVCFRSETTDKGTRTPYEWLADSDSAKFEQVLQRTSRLSYNKAQRIRQPFISLDDFFTRWFIDATYTSTQIQRYLGYLGADAVCTRGQLTPELRWRWGLNSVLRSDNLMVKHRDDYRHHAVNAIVIALTSRSRLQRLASMFRQEDTKQPDEVANDPWSGFRSAVADVVNRINVSHRVQRKVNGPLHQDTIYGPTAVPGQFAVRRPLESLTMPMINNIRDDVIKQLVVDRLRQHGVEPGAHVKLPKDLWEEPLRMKSGVPIRKVRILRRDLTIQPIRGGTANIKPRSIHHLCLFEFKDIRGKTKRDMVVVNMLQAISRIKARQPIIQRTHPVRPDAKFVMSISANETVALKRDGTEGLYRFQTAASTIQTMRFRHHTATGNFQGNLGVITNGPNTFEGRKVTVDPIGRVRWAND